MDAARRPHFYTISEAARVLEVSRSTVWRWVRSGYLAARRIGPRTIRINREEVDRFMRPAQDDGRESRRTPEAVVRSSPDVVNESPRLRKDLKVEPPPDEVVKKRLAALEKLKELNDIWLARRGGKPFPPSWPLIRRERQRLSRRYE